MKKKIRSEIFMVRITPDERAKLNVLAEKLNCSGAEVLRTLLNSVNSVEVQPAILSFRQAEKAQP